MESFSIDPWPIYIVVVTYIIHVLTNYLVRALVRALLLQHVPYLGKSETVGDRR